MSAAVLRDAHVRWMSGEAIPVSELATLGKHIQSDRNGTGPLAQG